MHDIIITLTLIISIIPTLLSAWSIIKFGLKILTVLQIFFFVVFVLPLGLDLLFGRPDYSNYPGFEVATSNSTVTILYCIIVILISYSNWIFRSSSAIRFKTLKFNKYISLLLTSSTLIPFILLLFAPDISYYYIYGGKPARNYNIQAESFHVFINVFTFISVIASSFLIVRNINKNILISAFFLIICIFDFWLNGKRTIVFVFSFFIGLLLLIRFKSYKAIIASLLILIASLAFSNWYQSNVRELGDNLSFEDNYKNLRIDFSRDQRVEMAIYSKVYPDKIKILAYPGQSLLFLMTFYISRDYWESKPYPYAVYFTSAIFNSEPRFWGWGMTTSIYDEFISNFGLIGVLLAQLLIIRISKNAMRMPSPSFQLATIFIILMMLMVQIIAFIVVYILYLAWYLVLKRKNARGSLEYTA